MNSSYKNSLTYKDIISYITWDISPTAIVEIGILDGYSLDTFVNSADNNCKIHAYDIFDEFIGNAADKDKLQHRFNEHENVNIEYGDFFKLNDKIRDDSIDILHIDIANNGDIYEYVFQNYVQKIKKGGVIILEGGSNDRDRVEWMNKYNKPMIQPVLEKYKNDFKIKTTGSIPSITVIKI
jgi:predicted O-methyltransferase YrrM